MLLRIHWHHPMLTASGVHIRSATMHHIESCHYFLMEWKTWDCCPKVISILLSKYDPTDYINGANLWNMFFTTIKLSVEKFIQECESSETPNSLFYLFCRNEQPFKACFISQERESACPQHYVNPVY